MKDKVDKVLGAILVALMAIMTIDVLIGVSTRYLMGDQVSWSEELARFLLIWIGILGAAYASGRKMHLAIDLLQPKLEPANQKTLLKIINILVILFALTVMIIGGFRLIYITHKLGQLSPAMRIPMALIYAVVPLSGIIVIYYKLLEFKDPRIIN